MLYIDSMWEYIVNFLELALFLIFIHTKLHIRANYKHQAVWMFLFVSIQFAVLCTLNKMGISSYVTLISSCVLDIVYAILFYRDNLILRIFWGFSYSIICLVEEQITFFIPVTLYKGASLELLSGGELRKPYTMLYLAMIAIFVLLFHYIGNKDISLSSFQKVAYICIAISGLAIGHYILRLTLESVDKFDDSSFSARLSLINLFFIVLFLALMQYIYLLGYSKEENIRLLEEQKIYELERTEFNSLSETAERLRKMKHDMQIYVDAINVLAKDKKWDETRRAEYQAVGVTIDGKNYYYQGQLVNIFMDVRANKSFYVLDTNPVGTVNIKIIRDANNNITGVTYMTDADVAELLEDMA